MPKPRHRLTPKVSRNGKSSRLLHSEQFPPCIRQKETAQQLEVLVIFTDEAGTLAALRNAEELAQQLEAHLRLLVPYEVPYALPLAKPPVPVEFLEGQIRNLAGKIRLGCRRGSLSVPR